MILVKDLNKEIFSSPFLEYLPETCESCGSPTEVLETFSSLQCSNPHCISKVGYRLFCLLRDLGITTLTVDECIRFLNKFESNTPYSVLLYDPEYDGEFYEGFGEEESKKLYSKINKRRGMLLWEFIKLGHFDNLSVSAEKLLKNYHSLAEFYKDLGAGGIPFIQNLLLENTDFADKSAICVDAVLIYETFVTYKEELEKGIEGVVILNPEKIFTILFANDVKEFENNQDFIHFINIKMKYKIYFYTAYSLDEGVDFVYWDDSAIDYNSIIKKCMLQYPNMKIVNEETIYNAVFEVMYPNGK